jgi:membrane dipeptidase
MSTPRGPNRIRSMVSPHNRRSHRKLPNYRWQKSSNAQGSNTSLDSRTGGNPKTAEMMKPRLISKEHAKVVADAGGVIGVWTHLADSLKDFVESIKAMVDTVGIDHAGIGTDTDLLSPRVGQGTNQAWPGLTGGFFQAVVAEMLLQGFTPDDIGKVGGGNFCRVFGKATAGHA